MLGPKLALSVGDYVERQTRLINLRRWFSGPGMALSAFADQCVWSKDICAESRYAMQTSAVPIHWMSSLRSFRTRSAYSARENELLTSGRSIVASKGMPGSTSGSRIMTTLGLCTRLNVWTIPTMALSAGFTTIKSMCESHMTASETACRQFNEGTMFHPALANNSTNEKVNSKSSSTIKAVGLRGTGVT